MNTGGVIQALRSSSAGSSTAGGIAAVVFSCTLFRFVTLRHFLSFIRGLRVSLNCVFSFLRKKALLAITNKRYVLMSLPFKTQPFCSCNPGNKRALLASFAYILSGIVCTFRCTQCGFLRSGRTPTLPFSSDSFLTRCSSFPSDSGGMIPCFTVPSWCHFEEFSSI